jgi:hypothetical protein
MWKLKEWYRHKENEHIYMDMWNPEKFSCYCLNENRILIWLIVIFLIIIVTIIEQGKLSGFKANQER